MNNSQPNFFQNIHLVHEKKRDKTITQGHFTSLENHQMVDLPNVRSLRVKTHRNHNAETLKTVAQSTLAKTKQKKLKGAFPLD